MGYVLLLAIPGLEKPEDSTCGWTVPALDDEFNCAYLWIFVNQVQTSVAMPDCSSDCKPVNLLESEG